MSSRRKPAQPVIKPYVDDRDRTRRGVALMIALMFGVFGLYNLFSGISSVVGATNFVEAGRKTEARVERVETLGTPRLGGIGTRETQHAVVSFVHAERGAQMAVSPEPCGRRCPAPGSSVPIAYDAGAPPVIRINDFTHIWGGPLESFLISLMSFFVVPVALLFSRPPRKDLPKQ